jgi:hypothetical protein
LESPINVAPNTAPECAVQLPLRCARGVSSIAGYAAMGRGPGWVRAFEAIDESGHTSRCLTAACPLRSGSVRCGAPRCVKVAA